MTRESFSRMISRISVNEEGFTVMKIKISNFAKFSWFAVFYNIMVILFGAFVRATGSGAGCGAHWPLCNGVVIPRPEQIETAIEFTHRVTSGLTLVVVLILVVWTWKRTAKGNILRTTAGLALFFTLTEALVGAALVLFGLVTDNDSTARVISMMVHLVNTFLLLASLALTAWWSTYETPKKLHFNPIGSWLVILGSAGILFLGASGAITALGDTLFPSTSVLEGLQSDFSETAHYLIRVRVFHPGIAIGIGVALWLITAYIRINYKTRRIRFVSTLLIILYFIQIIFGVVNVALLAPVWLQIIHLFQSNLIWVCFVLLSGEVLGSLPSGVVHQQIHKPVHPISG